MNTDTTMTTPTDATTSTDATAHTAGETASAGREGAPAWIDLGTPDVQGAMRFYGELFGWRFEDQGEEFGGYRLVYSGEDLIGGLMDTTGVPAPDGGEVPVAWTVYLRTPDMAAAVERMGAVGGRVLLPPMPVADRGFMGLAFDPAGALVGMWQPGTLEGLDLPMRAGTPVWFEVMSTDFDAALPFYRDVFGWDVHTMADDGWRYATHGPEAESSAGLCDARGVIAEGTPSFWRVYLGYEGIDAGIERVRELGGRLLDGPVDSPYGRLATVADPAGAMFQLIEAVGA